MIYNPETSKLTKSGLRLWITLHLTQVMRKLTVMKLQEKVFFEYIKESVSLYG